MNIFLKRFENIQNNLITLLPLRKDILSRISLDIMFIVDCTFSMGMWLDSTRSELKNIISTINEEYENMKIRLSFVGYRDFCDIKKRFAILDFIEDPDIMIDFILSQKATGGGDLPEDLAGGLEKALQQNWKSKIKYAILITDAPGHGIQYHSCVGDKYPLGDPEGRVLEDLISEFGKQDINLYAIKITEHTNKMYKIFEECFLKTTGKKFIVGNLGNSTKSFGFFVSATIQNSISKTTLNNDIDQIKEIIKNMGQENESVFQIDNQKKNENENINEQKIFANVNLNIGKTFLNFEKNQNFPILEAICHSWFIVKEKNIDINWEKPLIQKSQIMTKITIDNECFASGSQRYAFYMKDLLIKQNLIGKIPKIIDKKYDIEYMKKEIEVICISNHIINEFNDRIVNIIPNLGMLMNYVHCFIYEILNNKNEYKYWWVENLIEGEYEKFNNNWGWINNDLKQTSLIAQAFSHFSWQFTKGFLMIVDIQGVETILTDPQIHCLDKNRFGKGNLGLEGMIRFFYSHNCNFFCKKLDLINIYEKQKNFDLQNFYDINILPPLEKEILKKLCDLCRKPYEIDSLLYYKKRKNYPEIYCDFCEKEKNSSLKEGNCEICGKEFFSSKYWFIMKRTDFPVKCSKCRHNNRCLMREKLKNDN